MAQACKISLKTSDVKKKYLNASSNLYNKKRLVSTA
jgi:hypothetical protein